MFRGTCLFNDNFCLCIIDVIVLDLVQTLTQHDFGCKSFVFSSCIAKKKAAFIQEIKSMPVNLFSSKIKEGGCQLVLSKLRQLNRLRQLNWFSQLNWLRLKFWLKSRSNPLLINIFEPNSWNPKQSWWRNWLNWVWI